MRPTDLVSHFGGALPDLPVVQHEFGGYYCSLPDLSLLGRFTGVIIPQWLHAKKQWVDSTGWLTLPRVRAQLAASPASRPKVPDRARTAAARIVTGYHYWLIVDFPGGTGEGDSWEEGWFDYFWQPKGITPRDGQAINAAVLPLITARPDDRTFWNDTGRSVDVMVSNYGSSDLRDAELTWKLQAEGKAIDSGTTRVTLPRGNVDRVARLVFDASASDVARKLELVVAVDGAHDNSWTFWSFPRTGRLDRAAMGVHSTVKWAGIRRLYPFVEENVPEPGSDSLLVTPTLDDAALRHLRGGGRVWLMTEPGLTPARASGRLLSRGWRRAGHRRARPSLAPRLPARGLR